MSTQRNIGIDFGTHKTLVARWDEEIRRPVLIRLRPASGDDMPSAAHVSAAGQLNFGEEAEQLAVSDAEGYKRGFKRDLGLNTAPYLLHTHEFTAGELSREYLKWIKKLVEEESLHGAVEHAVITAPASWLPGARAELQKAADGAGFGSVELLDEPVAAGMAFLRSRRDLWTEGALLVFDWGAGTLDLAVLTLQDGRPQAIPDLIGGRAGLGGEDVDRHLLQFVNKRLAQLGLTKLERRTSEEVEYVRRKVNEWKTRYAAKPEATWLLTGLADTAAAGELKWTSAEIGERVQDKIKEAVDACGELLERAKAKGVVPTGILLVGGSSQFPAVKAMLEGRFPGIRLLAWDQRISAIALGAAWKAVDGKLASSPQAVAQSLPPPMPAVGPPALSSASGQAQATVSDPWEEDDGDYSTGYRAIKEVLRRFSLEQEAFDWSGIMRDLGEISVKFSDGKLELFDGDIENLSKVVRICRNAPLRLEIFGKEWSDSHLRDLSRLTNVRTLELGGCNRLTDGALRSIAAMQSLKSLTFTNPGAVSRMSLDGFNLLSRIGGLRFLDFPRPYGNRGDLGPESPRERRAMKSLLLAFATTNPELRTDPELEYYEDD